MELYLDHQPRDLCSFASTVLLSGMFLLHSLGSSYSIVTKNWLQPARQDGSVGKRRLLPSLKILVQGTGKPHNSGENCSHKLSLLSVTWAQNHSDQRRMVCVSFVCSSSALT